MKFAAVLLVLATGCTAFTPVGRRWSKSLAPRMSATVEKDAGGLEFVKLSHPSGASSKVFLFGGDVTSYTDAAGTEWIANVGSPLLAASVHP